MNSTSTGSAVAHYLFFFALVAGAKLLVIASYGNSIPVWDQWDAEIDRLICPWIEGTLRFTDLFASHNEHRVFTGRVLALSLFLLNGGVLDALLEMVANALLHTGALLLLLHGLLKLFPEKRFRTLLVLFAALFFSLPLGVENILSNNSSLYFLLLFSTLFLYALNRGEDHRWFRDIVVLSSGILACLSYASGALTFIAGFGLLAVQLLLGVRRSRSSILLMVTFLLIAVASIKLTPSIPAHGHYRSLSIFDFLFSILKMTGGGLFFLPSLVFMFRQLKRAPAPADPSWFLFGLCLWVFGQMIAIAYGRGHSNVLTSRYRDIYAIGYLANFAAILLNMKDPALSWRPWVMKSWFVSLCLVVAAVMPQVKRNLENSREDGIAYMIHVRSYLVSQNDSHLYADGAKIPYPDAARLKMLLDRKIVREMLPPKVSCQEEVDAENNAHHFASRIFHTGLMMTVTGICLGLYIAYMK